MAEIKLELIYKEIGKPLTQELITSICMSVHELSIEKIQFEGDSPNCSALIRVNDELQPLLMIYHHLTKELTEEDKDLFTEIWDELQQYRGMINIIFDRTTPMPVIPHLYKLVSKFKEHFEVKVWQEDFLMDFPKEKDFEFLFTQRLPLGSKLFLFLVFLVIIAVLGLAVLVIKQLIKLV